MTNLSVSKKMNGIVGLLVFTIIATALVSLYFQIALIKKYQKIEDDPKTLVVKDARIHLGRAIQGLKDYLIRNNEVYIKEYNEAITKLKVSINRYDELAYNQEEKRFAADLNKGIAIYEEAFNKIVKIRQTNSETPLATLDAIIKGMDRPIAATLNELSEYSMQQYEKTKSDVNKSTLLTARIQTGVEIIVGLLCAVLTFIVSRGIKKNVVRISDFVGGMAKGDFVSQLTIRSGDEFGQIALQLATMKEHVANVLNEIVCSNEMLAASSQE